MPQMRREGGNVESMMRIVPVFVKQAATFLCYLRILAALYQRDDINLLAKDDKSGWKLQDLELRNGGIQLEQKQAGGFA